MLKRLMSGGIPFDDSNNNKWELLLDLLAFLVTVIFVFALNWTTRDIIWGLWTCSLVVGYTWLLVAIISQSLLAEGLARIAAFLGGLFMIVFFTIHFGMFHFVHAAFLNGFFPLIETGNGFPDGDLLTTAISSYWPLVATTFLSRIRDFPLAKKEEGKTYNPAQPNGDALFMPYVNVVRMHILIFVFAGLQAIQMSDLAIYPVLAFYFFPWGRLLGFGAKKVNSNQTGEIVEEADSK